MAAMRSRSSCGRAGNANIEFALCAIFVIFLMLSIFDMARGLWIYHTLAEAVRDGTRYAMVRGAGYSDPLLPLSDSTRLPGATLGDVKKIVLKSATGLVPSQVTLTFRYASAAAVQCTGTTACSGQASPWPPSVSAQKGTELGISATYPYNSMVVMYFPGGKGMQLGKYVLGSSARERIVF